MQNKVKAPAIALIVVGVLAVLSGIYGLVMPTDVTKFQEAFEQSQLEPEQIDMITQFYVRFAFLLNLLPLLIGALLIFGGSQMMKLKSWGLAVTSSILAMFPCWCCCVIGIPIGIWSLIVLMDKDVKAAFGNPPIPPPL